MLQNQIIQDQNKNTQSTYGMPERELKNLPETIERQQISQKNSSHFFFPQRTMQ